MGLIGINAHQPKPQGKDALDRIAQGLQIAQGVLGVGLAIPEYLQKKTAAESQEKLAQAHLATAENEAKLAGPKMEIDKAKTISDAAKVFRPAKEGETPDVNNPLLGGALKYREKDASDLSDYEKNLMSQFGQDYTIVPKKTSKSIEVMIGGHPVYYEPKEADDSADKTRNFDETFKTRNEFLKQSDDFQKRADAYSTILTTAKTPSAAGDLSMVFSFMKMVDPGSTVREGEQATARNATGVSEQVRNYYNRVLTGESLNPAQRSDFVAKAGDMYNSSRIQHAKRERFYRGFSVERGLDPNQTVPDISLDSIIKNEQKSPEFKIVNGKKYQKVPGGWDEVK